MPLVCQVCGESVPFDEPIPRDAECAGCGTDLRACVQCRHYDTSRNNSCTETEADPVADKTRRNFCEFFYFSRQKAAQRSGTSSREDDARRKLNALFGGGSAVKPGGKDAAADARRKLDDLFRKKD